MKMNKDKIQKYHYWVLAGLAPLLALLGVLLYATGVGAEVDKRSKEIETKTKEVSGAKAKGKRVLELLDGQKVKLTDKREELWKDNWNRQAVEFRLFDWPTDPDPQQRLKRLADKSQKFGAPLANENDVFEVFKRPNVYEEAYNKLAVLIAPTTFLGGDWRGVFRHVASWGDRTPKSEQIWLALEDYWVQRGLMLPIKDVNDTASKYVLVRKPDGGEPEPLKRTFRNPVWEIDLEVVADPETRRQVLKSRLKNHTDRLQFLGRYDELRLNIWMSDRPTAQPIPYRIQMDMVKAGDTIDVPINPRIHTIPPGTEVEKIVRVEQVLDVRSVPVRQVMNVELGYKDSRMSNAPLKPHKSWPQDETAAAGASPFGSPPGMMGGPPGMMGGPPGMMGGPPGGMPFSRPGGPTGSTGFGFGAKGGTPESTLDLNKFRYLDSTDQVRRMPVAVVLLVDQLYMQDVLTAYANSPLRFQISQYHWRRFRGQLSSIESAASGSEFADSGFGSGFGRFRGGSPFGGGFTPSFTRQSTVSADQTMSGLIELSIYGIISLYEKYEEPMSAEESTEAPSSHSTTAEKPDHKPAEAPTEPKVEPENPKKPEDPSPVTTDAVPNPKPEE